MNDIIQLSASTFIDNSVCNFTEHQIEYLRGIASKSGFNGLLEPNFEKTRASGPFVCSWLEGERRHQVLVGRYRTMAWPQRQQFQMLQHQNTSRWKARLFNATNLYSYKDRSNDPDDVRNNLISGWNRLIQAEDSKNNEAYAVSDAALSLARDLIIFGNMSFAHEFTVRLENDMQKSVEPDVS